MKLPLITGTAISPDELQRVSSLSTKTYNKGHLSIRKQWRWSVLIMAVKRWRWPFLPCQPNDRHFIEMLYSYCNLASQKHTIGFLLNALLLWIPQGWYTIICVSLFSAFGQKLSFCVVFWVFERIFYRKKQKNPNSNSRQRWLLAHCFLYDETNSCIECCLDSLIDCVFVTPAQKI